MRDRKRGRFGSGFAGCALALSLGVAAGLVGCGDDGEPLLDPVVGQDGGFPEGSAGAAGMDAKVPEVGPDAAELKDAAQDPGTDPGTDPVADAAEAGPEADLPEAATDVVCGAPLTMCAGQCVALDSDPAHCGACDNGCSAGQVCSAGTCASTCGPLLANCGGACVSLSSDPLNCGACDNLCSVPNATASCADSKCAIASCQSGYADCNGLAADGCEISTASDPNNCGSCGQPCNVPNATAACATGQCAVGVCKAGYGDCDGVAANGCEVNLLANPGNCGACGKVCASSQVCSNGLCASSCGAGETACSGACVLLASDPANCGACGAACSTPHAIPACIAGQCAVGACLTGYADCNGSAADGCEVNVGASIDNCGACGAACLVPNGTPQCSAGVCSIGSCGPGYADCNGVLADGCETNLANDPNSCGSCGLACSLANATPTCAAGTCNIATCQQGFANCNGQAADGCEIAIASDVFNCGACGVACSLAHATASCSGGGCTIVSCDAGWEDCDGNPANGCEAAIGTDPANCGGCAKVCTLANATSACSAGQCVVATCAAGYANCDAAAANGCEVNLGTDGANCGQCATACPSGQVCNAGVCGALCGTGLTNCSGSCVVLSTDPLNCGACGNVCTLPNATEACVAGACLIAACDAGFANCNAITSDGCEANLQTSTANCGACGKLCNLPNASSTCTSGLCMIGSCSTGWADCDGLAATGCEVNTVSDPANCGGCGKACSLPNALEGCEAGNCTIVSCTNGFGDCDQVITNGCEMNLFSSASNCGTCGTVCSLANAVSNCSAGVCSIASCKPGYANCNGNAADGCEVNLNTDLNSCGSCGAVCNLANATASCTLGKCAILSCASGYADCDGNAANGCEVNLLADAKNCGTCGTACTSGMVCSAGVCASSCGSGLTNCTGACVNLQTDAANCGSCGFTCSLPNAVASCTAGLCTTASCNSGYANCDGLAANGCEVNLTNDVKNCGACAMACALPNATAACSASNCVIASCSAGYGDCDALAANGCEASTAADVANCGGCGRACSASHVSSKSCAAGLCTSSCQLGYGNCTKPAAPAVDDGCELAVSSNNTNCGACGNNCSLQGFGSGLLCNGGTRPENQCGCASNGACAMGGGGGSCDVATGLCTCNNKTCRPGEYCVKSGATDACSCNGNSTCAAGTTCCQTPAGCKDVLVDPLSCGACGRACPPGFACAAGSCVCNDNADCNAGSAGTCATGTCVCGSTSCAAGQRCLPGGICG
jgi:hypothetical protein